MAENANIAERLDALEESLARISEDVSQLSGQLVELTGTIAELPVLAGPPIVGGFGPLFGPPPAGLPIPGGFARGPGKGGTGAGAGTRDSESSPTFVNHESGPASDLHIVFKKGGVTVKNKGEASGVDRENTNGNEVTLTFPKDKPINNTPVPPAGPAPAEGAPVPATPTPPAGTTAKPTFGHSDPNFPGIEKWWWTHRVRRHGQDVDEPFHDAKGRDIIHYGEKDLL